MILVIITSYNAEKFISDAIKSVLNQIYKNFKLVIIDDASTDNTFEIIKQFESRHKNIIAHQLPENKGTYYARNFALHKYIKDYKYWILQGADDIMFPDKLSTQIREINSGDYIAATCKFKRVDYETKIITKISPVMHDCVLYKKEVFDTIGYYDSNTRFAGDSEYIQRVVNQFGVEKIYQSKRILYTAFDHKNNLTAKIPINSKDRNDYVEYYKDRVAKGILYRNFNEDKRERIKQIRVSSGVKFFAEKLKKKYNLQDYTNINEPVIFNGMYSERDYIDAVNHKGHLTIVWCGSDALNLKKYQKYLPQLLKARHIAKSEFISEDLKKLNIPHIILPITPTEIIKNIQPRGDKIYIYSTTSKNNYGYNMLGEIKEKTGLEIIETTYNKYTPEELKEVYKQCFIGLRLTKHDGLPNTVVELGLMGRRSIYNGKLPSAIPYKDVDDIVRIIKNEYKNRHINNSLIVEEMYNYLNIDESWLII